LVWFGLVWFGLFWFDSVIIIIPFVCITLRSFNWMRQFVTCQIADFPSRPGRTLKTWAESALVAPASPVELDLTEE